MVIAIVLGALGASYIFFQHEGNNYSPGSTYGTLVPIDQAISLMRSPPSYAHVFSKNDSIVFTSHQIDLVVLTMGHKRAENLTGMNASGNVFVIYGLVNPTLIMPSNAQIHVTVINLDAGDYHNFVVSSQPPPYQYNVMMGGMQMMGGGKMDTMMPYLPPADYSTEQAHQYQYTFTLNQGEFWYICTFPGHAENGMYGEIVVGE